MNEKESLQENLVELEESLMKGEHEKEIYANKIEKIKQVFNKFGIGTSLENYLCEINTLHEEKKSISKELHEVQNDFKAIQKEIANLSTLFNVKSPECEEVSKFLFGAKLFENIVSLLMEDSRIINETGKNYKEMRKLLDVIHQSQKNCFENKIICIKTLEKLDRKCQEAKQEKESLVEKLLQLRKNHRKDFQLMEANHMGKYLS